MNAPASYVWNGAISSVHEQITFSPSKTYCETLNLLPLNTKDDFFSPPVSSGSKSNHLFKQQQLTPIYWVIAAVRGD